MVNLFLCPKRYRPSIGGSAWRREEASDAQVLAVNVRAGRPSLQAQPPCDPQARASRRRSFRHGGNSLELASHLLPRLLRGSGKGRVRLMLRRVPFLP